MSERVVGRGFGRIVFRISYIFGKRYVFVV